MTVGGVIWTSDAERDLLAMPPSEAERVLDEVESFATTGRGFVRQMLDGSYYQRLYVERYYIVFDFDGVELTVHSVRPR